ncbi:pentatricopeptide repeat-containing protein At4g33990 [Andrographis paniculata]|uniref:pentatricopeptide repeat-containing protein At4g33990 n=1 Tax=Andrographis paniculata TaxID=175694 RepID=UPI0021E7BF6A|nr:pentatricopeptide repeat-containing protein At4g33990 [Andrographis paniculata]
MFRLLPIGRSGHLLNSPSSRSYCLLDYQRLRYIRSLSNGTGKRSREIDFELLYDTCTTAEAAKRVHALLIVSGKAWGSFVATRLVNLYSHLGDVSSSRKIFNRIQRKDAYTWNSMVSAYVRSRHFGEAVRCAFEMLSNSDARPDSYTFPAVLKACTAFDDGRRLHCWIVKLGFEWDLFVAASLVHMYCRFSRPSSAYNIFKEMPYRDMGCWNSMISGFCQCGNAKEAFRILNNMGMEGIRMDSVTVVSILSVCALMSDKLYGMLIHVFTIKQGMEFSLFVSNALINMYAKFGELICAQNVFDDMAVRDIVSWNSIIAAYEQNDCPIDALRFFHRMRVSKVKPDVLTLVSLASSAAQTKNFLFGYSVHGYVVRRCWITADTVIGNAIVDMYAKLGVTDSAQKVFDELPYKDVIAWNTMIAGYAQNGLASEAIKVFRHMKESEHVAPNLETWVSILPAYAHIGALREGKKIHNQAVKEGLDSNSFLGTCLIDLYGKCGRLDEAMSLFYNMSRETSVPWNAVILCHGLHGNGETSVRLFNEMLSEGIEPDHVTFVSLLTGCSHSGFVDLGERYFRAMKKDYGIKPIMKHYGCMVDLYGRAGLLQKAIDFIEMMPVRPDATIWGAVLGACRIHGNVELGRKASDRLFEIDSSDVGYYVLMSNLYANLGRWDGADEMRLLARDRGLRKTPGWSSIELNSNVEIFFTGNQSHPQSAEIYKELAKLTAKMKSLGYFPDHSFVLQDVEDDEKENILTSHSERLAIMYGILNTPPKTMIRIYKNLRVCGDCHTVTKFISKITEREIIVRDSNRFHRFHDGACSCGDYW